MFVNGIDRQTNTSGENEVVYHSRLYDIADFEKFDCCEIETR